MPSPAEPSSQENSKRRIVRRFLEYLSEDPRDPVERAKRNTIYTLIGLCAWALLTVVLLVIYALGFKRPPWDGVEKSFWGVLSAGGILSIGFGAIGGFFGFLFGIPRGRASDEQAPDETPGDAAPADDKKATRKAQYTNIETISDWLTKVLIGAGLTQLNELPTKLRQLGVAFQPMMGGSWSVTTALILNGSVGGFFAGYLLTRLFLTQAFREADDYSLRSDLAQVKGELIQSQAAVGALAAVVEDAAAPAVAVTDAQAPAPVISQKDKATLSEARVFNYLYEEPPEGFEKAIKYIEGFLSDPANKPTPRMLAYLSMAYGQKAKWEMRQRNTSAPPAEWKQKAYDSARRAIKEDERIKSLLKMVWDPYDTVKSPGDDDLEVFYSDQDFKALMK